MYSKNKNETSDYVMQQGFYTYLGQSLIWTLIFIVMLQSSCKKFVDIETPPDKLTQANVYSNDLTATTVLSGIYGLMYISAADMSKYSGLLSDELTLWTGADPDLNNYYTNSLISTPTTNIGEEIWNNYYNLIFTCNGAIEGLGASNSLTTKVKKQLTGEAYFMRAWFYFYLVNLYGDLPLAVSTDPIVNSKLSRSSKESVYQLIISDLLNAQKLLNSEFVNGQLNPGTQERVRPTTWAASAMLARAYLYSGDYVKAEGEASKVIADKSHFDLTSYDHVFLKNSHEAIWQLHPTEIGWNTMEARMFHLSKDPIGFSDVKPAYLSSSFLNAFESGDHRKTEWIDSYDDGVEIYFFPVKYKVGEENPAAIDPGALTEYGMMLRLGEQYLIRAEARARRDNRSGAIADLDQIRNRAGLPLIANTNPGISQNALLTAILRERQMELFTEWGHRWFDLKRFGKVDEVMSVVTPTKGGSWESTDQLLPIPYEDLLYGANLTQNQGY